MINILEVTSSLSLCWTLQNTFNWAFKRGPYGVKATTCLPFCAAPYILNYNHYYLYQPNTWFLQLSFLISASSVYCRILFIFWCFQLLQACPLSTGSWSSPTHCCILQYLSEHLVFILQGGKPLLELRILGLQILHLYFQIVHICLLSLPCLLCWHPVPQQPAADNVRWSCCRRAIEKGVAAWEWERSGKKTAFVFFTVESKEEHVRAYDFLFSNERNEKCERLEEVWMEVCVVRLPSRAEEEEKLAHVREEEIKSSELSVKRDRAGRFT